MQMFAQVADFAVNRAKLQQTIEMSLFCRLKKVASVAFFTHFNPLGKFVGNKSEINLKLFVGLRISL